MANPAPPAARPHIRARAIQRASAMPGSARRAIPAPNPHRAPSWRRRSARAALRLDELSEFLEFQPRPPRRHPRDKPSAIAVEKAKMQQVILKPAPWRRQPHGRSPAALALAEQLLCHDRCVALDFRLALRKRADRVVQQVSTQMACLSFETQGRMDHSGKAGFVSQVEPALKIRIPSRVTDPRTEVPGEARHLVNWKFRLTVLPLH